MRALLLLLGVATPATALAQPVVTSPRPDRVALTVYRNADRGMQPLNLQWLGGFALVSETRRVRLPAGESELRFEGVTSGLVPQSAIVTGLGPAVLEKNRDARLLSPGSLLAAHLGQRLTLRRTSKATGVVREQEAIVRATDEGVVLETENGIEALRCSGIAETLTAARVPEGLSAKPTLSIRVRSPRAVEQDVTLSYITNNFDWQADYIADLSDDGRTLRLFGWLTLANGDDTGLQAAATQAVAGTVNRDRVWVDRGSAPAINLSCWPQGTTSDIPLQAVSGEEIVVTGSRVHAPVAPPPPPPPPPAAMAEADVMAQQERLGDVQLYRIPISVTVAARSQKQVALMQRPAVKVERLLRLRLGGGSLQAPLQRVLQSWNSAASGLGDPLPAGKLALFSTVRGRRILIGEGRIGDHAPGEKVEIVIGHSPGVIASQKEDGPAGAWLLTLANSSPLAERVEIELPLGAQPIGGDKLVKRDGIKIWSVQVPANGSASLRYRL